MQATTKFIVKSNRTIHLLSVNEIVRCLAESNYCFIFYGEGFKVYLAKTLKAVSHTLPGNDFIRVHRSHIVRRDLIHLVHNDHLVLMNGEVIPVSRRFKKKMVNYECVED